MRAIQQVLSLSNVGPSLLDPPSMLRRGIHPALAFGARDFERQSTKAESWRPEDWVIWLRVMQVCDKTDNHPVQIYGLGQLWDANHQDHRECACGP